MLPDFSSFYRQNEKLAEELERLTGSGALDRLLELLDEGGLKLEIRSWSPTLKQEEYLGNLVPGRERPWDHEQFMAERSEQTVETGDETRSIYMPDHICPACGNDRNNYIKSAVRVCDGCGFKW